MKGIVSAFKGVVAAALLLTTGLFPNQSRRPQGTGAEGGGRQ